MPYAWTPEAETILTLRPHRSLPRRGFAAVVLLTFLFGSLPLFGVLGTVYLWGILPFLLAVVGGLWWGLERSYRDGEILETLRRSGDDLILRHHAPDGPPLDWRCNIYWVRAQLHETGGPVPGYLTLSGNGREVEIGRFLSEEERRRLFGELLAYLGRNRTP